MIEHRNLVNYALAAIEWFGLGAGDTVLQQNSLNFDLSLEEIVPALLAGGAAGAERAAVRHGGRLPRQRRAPDLCALAQPGRRVVARWGQSPPVGSTMCAW